MVVPTKRAAPIVVGVDGSTSARDAVGLAAAEALHRRRPLRLVHAQLLVELLAGSTALAVSTYGHCPVTVVRGTVPMRGPVVVGVDGTTASEPAIELAFDRAALDGADLIAVHVWHPRISGLGLPLGEADRLALTSDHHRLLAERFAGWQGKYPDVHVERVVAEGHVARRLADYSDTARLLVVGPRGHGRFAGLLLGSTSQALLHHAPCPVLVVRADSRSAAATA